MSYFTVYKYQDNLYQIKDTLGVLATLLIGRDKALLFDTTYGIGNLKQEVEKLTDLPLIVVNSHGHMDHTCGNYQFDKVYIHPLDIKLVRLHNSRKWREANIKSCGNNIPTELNVEKYLSENEGNLIMINPKEIIDLGGLTCEVIEVPGHTQGSIALFIKEEKLMLVSDATCPFVWLFLNESTSVETYVESVKKLLSFDFDHFLVGHGPKLLPKSRMIEFLQVALDIDLIKSVKVTFNNFENLNSYCYTKSKMYDQESCGVIFDPNKLK